MINKGELTFIPAGTTLIRFSEEGTVGEWKNIRIPATVAVAGSLIGPNDAQYYSVIHEGQKWLARPYDCFEILERSK
tara:strand:- start:307 stop:537 length:231 start_codon:yes stop_codon:yes gene_type:complete